MGHMDNKNMDKSDSKEGDKELIEKLLRMVKREVKQIMEEAVTRKFVHEDSGSITSLCAAVDACLCHGLKRRALGLFKTNSTTALLQKVAKNNETAALVLKKVTEVENSDPNNSDSLNKTRMSFKIKSQVTNTSSNTSGTNANATIPRVVRFLWIRIALFDKHLVSIVDHVVQNSSRYYEKDALVSDPVAGQILASLLVGPCALDYSKMKTQDQFWSDPPADELVQRHRISSSLVSSNSTASSTCMSQSTPPITRKPLGLTYRRPGALSNFCNGDDDQHASSSPISRSSAICWSPRDYVESLHQNSRSTLLYGKNNVIMQPKDDLEPLPGYLSLHQETYGLIVKWTPNQLINGRASQNSTESGDSIGSHSLDKGSAFWNHALNVSVENIVYIHCHQQKHSCGSIVMVGRDGVMHPPIKFPKGGHLLAFLSCLETGLMPYGQLDPPLWSQKGKGKVFPKLRRKGQSPQCSEGEECTDDDDDVASDYVFRVISMFDKPDSIGLDLLEPQTNLYHVTDGKTRQTNDENMNNNEPLVMEQELNNGMVVSNEQATIDSESVPSSIGSMIDQQHIQILCDTMRKQIISRAFYGWLAYCRHLKTVRTHLADLVNQAIVLPDQPNDATGGISIDLWNSIQNEQGQITIDPSEFYRLIYYGGIEHSIRKKVWPYLLEHYRFQDKHQDKLNHDDSMRQKYEMIMSDWLAVEAIVRQRDKEIVAANLAKLSSESNNSTSEAPFAFNKNILANAGKSASNDVFEADFIDDISITDSRKSSLQSVTRNDINEMNETSNVVEDENVGVEENVNSISNGVSGLASKVASQVINLQNIFITNPSMDQSGNSIDQQSDETNEVDEANRLPINLTSGESGGSQCVSPASSNGGIYSNELLDLFSLNLHRIDKDVQRCDRNYWYFTKTNLEKLRNVMCTYVWEHLEIGYVQGMCDLVAPLLVIFDDEVFTYSCFCELMKRMASNFPHGGAMDTHFANMRSLIQILDGDIFELMHQNGDYTHFYFCYRWFLLDFKRELVYADVFSVWETIWAAKHVSSSSFVLFIALALVEYYRDIILENNMDFTDIIKFFNEMAERHDAKAVLRIARDLVLQIQSLIDDK